MMPISWESTDSFLLTNPRYSKEDQARFQQILDKSQEWPGHVWLSTSGSSNQKWVGLSKKAFLTSAKAVNKHLDSNHEDTWIHALPDFHVGGIGIWARAYLSGAKVQDFKKESYKWLAEKFYDYLIEKKGTLTSLVPTQLYDLVGLRKRCPPSLRAVIVGGGVLVPYLYEQAVELDWPVLPSYGLTECASQVATARLTSWKEGVVPKLQLLPHLQVMEREGLLCFKGSSLLSVYASFKEDHLSFEDPKREGWFKSEDRGCINDEELEILGRVNSMIKIGGENVDLARLEMHLQSLLHQMQLKMEATLVSMPDDRLGQKIHLVVSNGKNDDADSIVHAFQKTVLPFERIHQIHFVSYIPRSPLGKILQNELLRLII